MQPLRIGLAVLMVLHGIAHLPGFANSWRLATFPDLPYHTTLLGGRLEIGDAGMRVAGALWLAAALAFCLAGAGAVLQRGGWMAFAIAVAAASLVLCLLEWPAARIGVWVNVAILLALVLAQRLHWFASPAAG
ncbi:MAG TPA: hypothetical protein VGX50_06315 [Longimicrobium sp.]|jgi:hypothetical protein|nr:hypothetical protein [Longimicrobium sp.]